jgi:hypothetical protein
MEPSGLADYQPPLSEQAETKKASADDQRDQADGPQAQLRGGPIAHCKAAS